MLRRSCDLGVEDLALDKELPSNDIEVLHAQHLASPEPSVAAEQHD